MMGVPTTTAFLVVPALVALVLLTEVSTCLETTSIGFSSSFDALRGKRVLVVGGSGRVGGSVVTQLVRRGADVTVGGTQPERFETSQRRWLDLFPGATNALRAVEFVRVDRENSDSVTAVLQQQPQPEEREKKQEYDLVVHTAGPFQGKADRPNGVLEACVRAGVPYVDVCDDYSTALAAKSKFAVAAEDLGVPCIISTGCWPGVSSLMAKQLIGKVLTSYPDVSPRDLQVDFSFFTAGSGGAGAALLVATFLILAEKALTVVRGKRRPVQAMKDYKEINFGPVVGTKPVGHLNLLETASVAEVLRVGTVSSRFGTAPGFWNALLGFMAQLPPSLLSNEDLMRKLSLFSLPLVRLVDYFAGATNAMRCDVSVAAPPSPAPAAAAVSEQDDNDPASSANAAARAAAAAVRATAIYAHENLEPCVGECVAAFCVAALSEEKEYAVKPGVWFPEEAIRGEEQVATVLRLAGVGAHTLDATATGIDVKPEDVWGRPLHTKKDKQEAATIQ